MDGLPIFTKTDEGILELLATITHNYMDPKGKDMKNMIMISNMRSILSISNQLFLHGNLYETVIYGERELQKILNAEKVRIYLKDISDSVIESTHFDKKFISLAATDNEELEGKEVSTKAFYFSKSNQKKEIFELGQGLIGKVLKTGEIHYIKDVFKDPNFNCKKINPNLFILIALVDLKTYSSLVVIPMIPSTAFEIVKANHLKSQIIGGIEVCLTDMKNGYFLSNFFRY